MSPLVSVVVPIYNVERYLAECLESLAGQTYADLEVVMVDDGSTDSSALVAKEFADRDPRFRLVQQPNGGLGHARNTGARHATGDFIAFVDSDDVVVANAYELLVGSLQETGSDFASGNYHRLTTTGTWQSAMVAGAFTANRLRTHVTKHPALLNDRTAWNKLFRRTFWDQHRFEWPEGVLYEDIPVTLPAHVLARSVDVLRQPIYLWRARAGDSSSITQRRTEPRAIRDRYRAVDGVSRFLAEHGERDLKKQYDRSVAEQDLRYFMVQLGAAGEEFRALFLELANDYFDRAGDDVFDTLPAIRRLQWYLVRRRMLPELLEVLRFEESDEIDWTPVVRKGRRFWGDYPFRGDPRLGIPDDVYRLDRDEIPLRATIEDVLWRDDRLTLVGWAHIAFLDLSREGSARIRLTLEESGHPESVVAMDVRVLRRPDVTESSLDGVTCYDWCGFEASVPVDALRRRGRFRDGHWRLRVEVRSHGILRRRWLARTEPGRAQRPALRIVDGARVIPTSERGDFAVQVSTRAAEVTDLRVEGTVLELHGLVHGRDVDPATAALRVARTDGTATRLYPAATGGPATEEGQPFVVRVPTAELSSLPATSELAVAVEDHGDGVEWSLELEPGADAARAPLVAAPGLPQPRWDAGAVELAVRTTRTGRLRVLERHFRPEVHAARWTADGELELDCRYHEPTGAPAVLVLREAERDDEYAVEVSRDGTSLSARVDPRALPTVAGPLPLAEGQWDLYLRSGGAGHSVRVKVDHALLEALPAVHDTGARTHTLVDVAYDSVALVAGSDLPPRHRGHGGAKRLQTQEYPASLLRPLLDQVLVDGYAAGQYAADARSLVEELRRRRPDVPVLWSVLDGQAALPDGVTAVVRHGAQWYEALARSRWAVATDLHGVGALAKREGQRVLQTWHGVPVAATGLDDHRRAGRSGTGWEEQVRREAARWDVLLASGPAGAALLRRAFDYDGTVLETGLPRHDRLVAPPEGAAGAVRAALGIPPGALVVLYAPTYRHDLPYGHGERQDRFRFELDLDLEGARAALGGDAVLVVRPHPSSVDSVPWADGSSVVDASRWPDAGDLVLAADVLVSDRSSLLVDAALAGRPVLRWSADGGLGTHAPGYPDVASLGREAGGDAQGMLRAAVDVARGAAGDTGDTGTYAEFLATWCPRADGSAASRAVDALLEG